MAQTVGTGLARLRRPARGGFGQQVAARGLQAGRIEKLRELDLADLGRLGRARRRRRDGAVGGDGDVGRALRHLEAGLERIALARHHATLAVQCERTVAGIGGLAVGHQHLEKTIAFDGDVERVRRDRHIALRMDARGAGHAHAGAHRQADRELRIAAVGRADLADVLIGERLEIGAVALEADRGDVGEVVRDDAHAHVLRFESGLCDAERGIHRAGSFGVIRRA